MTQPHTTAQGRHGPAPRQSAPLIACLPPDRRVWIAVCGTR